MRALLALLLLAPIGAWAQAVNPSAGAGLPTSGGTLTGPLAIVRLSNGTYSMYSSNTPSLDLYSYVSGTSPSGLIWNAPYHLAISGDTMDYTNSDSNYLSALRIDRNFGGSAMKGSRAGIDLSMVMTSATGNTGNNNAYYVGIADLIQCNHNDNGTSGFANVSGSCVAFNPRADLGAGTFWYTLNTEEIDTVSAAGSSSEHEFGSLYVKSGGGPQGVAESAMIAAANANGSTWNTIIQIGKTDGSPPTDSSTTLLRCQSPVSTTTTCPIGHGIDLTNFTITTAAYQSPGFSVDGAGNVAAKTTKLAVVTVAGLPTCNSGAEGTLAAVSDANASTLGATLAGGGSNHLGARCNGTNWVAF